MNFFKTYLVAVLVFFIIDIVWLVFIANNLYQQKIGHLMSENINWTAALLFYLLFIAGMIFFVIKPALTKESWIYALLVGGFFGLITYATYDMTNLATLKDWSLYITIVDIIWGTLLCSITSVVTFFIMNYFGGVNI
ncbi:DUF2177 family protein [Sporosarcina sp. CAU 1771]